MIALRALVLSTGFLIALSSSSSAVTLTCISKTRQTQGWKGGFGAESSLFDRNVYDHKVTKETPDITLLRDGLAVEWDSPAPEDQLDVEMFGAKYQYYPKDGSRTLRVWGYTASGHRFESVELNPMQHGGEGIATFTSEEDGAEEMMIHCWMESIVPRTSPSGIPTPNAIPIP